MDYRPPLSSSSFPISYLCEYNAVSADHRDITEQAGVDEKQPEAQSSRHSSSKVTQRFQTGALPGPETLPHQRFEVTWGSFSFSFLDKMEKRKKAVSDYIMQYGSKKLYFYIAKRRVENSTILIIII